MRRNAFRTTAGEAVPAITAAEMRDVDRVAVDDFGLPLARMIEHAGRSLARVALASSADACVVLAGRGGNGGGGLACARHLAARDRLAAVVCSRPRASFSGAPASQLRLLERMDAPLAFVDAESHENTDEAHEDVDFARADLVVDALIGYGLSGPPRGADRALIEAANAAGASVVSLDVPSGLDATTGATPGVAIEPARTVTLALPKTGLVAAALAGDGNAEGDVDSDHDAVGDSAAAAVAADRDAFGVDTPPAGDLLLADLGIPPAVYAHADLPATCPFGDRFLVSLEPAD